MFFFYFNNFNQVLLIVDNIYIKIISFLISTVVQPIVCSGSEHITNTVLCIDIIGNLQVVKNRYVPYFSGGKKIEINTDKNGRFHFTRRSHNVPIYMKVQIIHQAVAKTKTVLSAKATLMNTRPTRHTFILCVYTLHILYYILNIFLFFSIGLHIMHSYMCARVRVHIYLPTLHT